MTLVFGALCKDGVVVVGDKRMTSWSGGPLPDAQKIHGVLRHIIFGYAGSEDAFDIFTRYVVGDLEIKRDANDKYTSENNLDYFCLAVKKLIAIRMNQSIALSVIVARQFPGEGRDSDLHIIDDAGNIMRITERYIAIGSGKENGTRMIDAEWNLSDEITMKDFAKIAYYAIRKIEAGAPEGPVGGDPTIVYLGHQTPDDQAAPAGETKEFQAFFEARQNA